MTEKPMTDGPSGSEGQLKLFDDDELDIAHFLREEGDHTPPAPTSRSHLATLALGAIGVVYGDIGTSPIYAFRSALKPVAEDGLMRSEVLGILSLIIWTLILIVTVKYVMVLLRADNRGEGGVLALYTLARVAIGRRSVPVLILAIAGAALFAGDAIITPAISVLSAVEGVQLVVPHFHDWVVPLTLGILMALFLVQRQGTNFISFAFGPITALWFLMLAGLGLWNIWLAPTVLASINPYWAFYFLLEHSTVSFVVLGAVFLAVTGAEALYADLGHFGRRPIAVAWVAVVFPSLVLNYLGQGALVLNHPEAVRDPFYLMAPDMLLPFVVAMATAATVIAAQAVISGAFSMARSAIQLGLLPRMTIRHTSSNQSGQIYIASVNWGLLFGVLWLVLGMRTSDALASAYGIAVTGTMIITTALLLIYLDRERILRMPYAIILASPIIVLELAFLASNLTKLHEGGYIPLAVAFATGTAMWSWWRGTQIVMAKSHKQLVGLDGFVKSMGKSSVHVVPGTAFFLTPDPTVVPSALLHNLKHNRVLHEQNVLLTVETLRKPAADEDERAEWEPMDARFGRLTLRFGFMETPNISRAMVFARKAGLKFDVMSSSFFLGRRRPVVTAAFGLSRLLDRFYAMLNRFAADPSDYYHLPRDRVVELGERVSV